MGVMVWNAKKQSVRYSRKVMISLTVSRKNRSRRIKIRCIMYEKRGLLQLIRKGNAGIFNERKEEPARNIRAGYEMKNKKIYLKKDVVF